jgi:ADP-heptose:LPS heptosyltransferase
MSLLKAENPVAFFVNGIGDHLLSLPAIRALAALYPQRLSLVCQRRRAGVFFRGLPFRQILVEDVWGDDDWQTEVAEAARGCDLFLSLVPWQSDSLTSLRRRLAPEVSVGFFPDYDVALPLDYSKHSSDLAFSLPRYLDPSLRLEDFAAPPNFPPEAERRAERIRGLIPLGTRVLVVHADTAEAKMWPAERFVAVLDAFLERRPDFVTLVVGRRRLPLDAGRFNGRVVLCYGLPLGVSLCLTAKADVFLGVDSCFLHAADFCGVPGVGLFGSTNSNEFGYRLTSHRHVCGGGDMKMIGEADVLAALDSLLDEVVPA